MVIYVNFTLRLLLQNDFFGIQVNFVARDGPNIRFRQNGSSLIFSI